MAAVLEEVSTLDPDKEYEIVNGIPEEKEMAGAGHGRVGAKLLARLSMFAEENDLGVVYGPDTTFKVGVNDRLPDISFVAIERIPEIGDPEGQWQLSPNLAVEVVSPTDFHEKVINKVLEYLESGVAQVWLVSPEHKTITIYYSLTAVKVLGENDVLTCQELLPGFSCRISDLFKLPKRR